jgi:hypothetical protein
MDGRGFDDLTRNVAQATSRRSLLRGLIGGGAAVVATKAGTTLAQPDKISICHWDEYEQGYVLLSISERGWVNGHQTQHEEDEQLSGAPNCCTYHECGANEVCAVGDDGYTECVCGLDASDCDECYQVNPETCACEPSESSSCAEGAGFCADEVRTSERVCVTERFGHDTGTDRDDCRNRCDESSDCGTDWVCVTDSGCSGAAHCHQLA